MSRRQALLAVVCLLAAVVSAQTPNEKQARRIFDEVYQRTFGNEGCTLHYAVNIIGIYKTEGTIWQKGKKSKYVSDRGTVWNDGTFTYVVPKKQQTVKVYSSQSEKRDKHMSKFQFNPDYFSYHIASQQDGLLITLKATHRKSGIKEIHALVDAHTHAPKSLRIKLGIIWTKVLISDYHAGSIDDSFFVFPRQKYKDYKFIDKTKE